MNVDTLINALKQHGQKYLWLNQLKYDITLNIPNLICNDAYNSIVCPTATELVISPMSAHGHAKSVQDFMDEIDSAVKNRKHCNEANCKVHIEDKSGNQRPLTTLPIVENGRVHLIYV